MNTYHRASLAAILVIVSVPAEAAPVLDQFNLIGPPNLANGAFSFTNNATSFRRLQTLTVGITGLLSQVDIQYNPIYGVANFTGAFNVFGTTAAGIPNSTLLGSGTLISNTGGFGSFSTNIGVTAGQTIAIEPFYTGMGAGWSAVFGVSTYAGGTGFDMSPGLPFVREEGDYGFRTFVNATAVPETGTWAMMVVGIGAIGAAARRRAKVRTTIAYS